MARCLLLQGAMQNGVHTNLYGASRAGARHHLDRDQFLVAQTRRTARIPYASSGMLDGSRARGPSQACALFVGDECADDRDSARSGILKEALESLLAELPWAPRQDLEFEATLCQELREVAERCCERSASRANGEPERGGVALAFVHWPLAFLVSTGEHRIFRLHRGGLKDVTPLTDITPTVMEERDPAQPSSSVRTIELDVGDTLLVASAGIVNNLDKQRIEDVLAAASTPRMAGDGLLEALPSALPRDATVALAAFDLPLRETAQESADVETATEALDLPSGSDPRTLVGDCEKWPATHGRPLTGMTAAHPASSPSYWSHQ